MISKPCRTVDAQESAQSRAGNDGRAAFRAAPRLTKVACPEEAGLVQGAPESQEATTGEGSLYIINQ